MVKLVDIIKQITAKSCPYVVNFHSHTIYSDGSLTPIQLINQATDKGVKHIAVTDHHCIKSFDEINNWILESRDKGLKPPTFWSGIEISCILQKSLVHILGFGFDVKSNSIYPYTKGESVVGYNLQAKVVIKAIQDAGGIAILAHPARYRLDFNNLIDHAVELNIDGVETWYNYNQLRPWQPTPIICELVDKKVKSLGLLGTCGTDTHGFDITIR